MNRPLSVAPIHSEVCARCGVEGSDLKILNCGCFLHVRCTPVLENSPLSTCPGCQKPCRSLFVIPMSFVELDEARQIAAASSASGKREKKRKTATIARLNPEVSAAVSNSDDNASDDLRTGRWTNEEMEYCDKLVEKFKSGELPVADGIKLNDFLASMLKSKQSRLTKKMKNAKLSARAYKCTTGYVVDRNEARVFSELELRFFRSISCSMEKAEIRFHVQKEWREIFSAFCVHLGQKLDADDWLNSVEEMDRRASRAKDAAKMARRKRMMGYALQQDQMQRLEGVFIEALKPGNSPLHAETLEAEDTCSAELRLKRQRGLFGAPLPRKSRIQPPPFLGRLLAYVQRHFIPFEYIDAWVPSFVSQNEAGSAGVSQTCRLCFAGCVVAETQVDSDGRSMIPLPKEEQFDLHAFGDYSQRFSFDVGCGLPGRVYQSGIASWEQGVHHAPVGHFERIGGAVQWGVKTVLGIPVPSPNVGRIVVLFYSRRDRPQNQDMAARIVEEMAKLMPSPKWKLVVDVGAAVPPPAAENSAEDPTNDSNQEIKPGGSPSLVGADGLLRLLTEYMPTDSNSPLAPYLHGFTSLRMMLLRGETNQQFAELKNCLVQSYESYLSTGRQHADIAMLVVRDFLALTQNHSLYNPMPAAVVQAAPNARSQQFHQQPQVIQHSHQQHQFHDARIQQQGLQHIVSGEFPPSGVGGVGVSVEPTPVSQMRSVSRMPSQQAQGQVAPSNQYQQAQSGQVNQGTNHQFLIFKGKE